MPNVLTVILGTILTAVIGTWAWVGRERSLKRPDLGTISGQWIAEHRAQERQSSSRH